jgi:hypothetical protein
MFAKKIANVDKWGNGKTGQEREKTLTKRFMVYGL